MTTTTDNAIDKASSNVHSAIDQVALKAKSPVDRLATLAHNASDKALDAGNAATEWVADRADRIAAPSKKMLDDASSYVSANPLKSMGIAVVAALIVGRLMR